MKEPVQTDFDVIIVGAGMVGACMARLLRDLPLRVALLDRQAIDSEAPTLLATSFEPRVSAISLASQRLLRELSLWDDICAWRTCPYREMAVWDAEGTGHIDFAATQIQQTELGHIVENSLITAALRAAIVDRPNPTLIAPVEVSALADIKEAGRDRVRLTLADGGELTADLLIAADGANSSIRRLADFATREWDYRHTALVTTVRTERPHQHRALQRFLDSGPLAFLPLLPAPDSADQHYCSIVWSTLPEYAERLQALEDGDFATELGIAIEHRLGEIEWSDRRFSFPLRQRHAVEYVKGNIVLVGDAAHTIHPLAGQGANLGLLDARALAEELERGRRARRAVSDATVLRRYQRRRIGHNLGMMWLMEGFKQLFSDQPLPVRWLRNVGMSGIDNRGAIKRELALRAMGVE